MADEEHLAILKQGVMAWNEWRRENPETEPDLSDADLGVSDLRNGDFNKTNFSRAILIDTDFRGTILRNTNFTGADFTYANFDNTNLNEAILSGAKLHYGNFNGANFEGADLRDIDLRGAKLESAKMRKAMIGSANFGAADLVKADMRHADGHQSIFVGANLSYADLSHADLYSANFEDADLSDANLSNTSLLCANLSDADLDNSNFSNTKVGSTTFANNDLRSVKHLDIIKHVSPSYISIDTLRNSAGKGLDAFLRGCGLSDWEIESAKLYNPNLSNEEVNDIQYRIHDLRVSRAFQINPLFISYSHNDSVFVDILETYLTKQGIRFWRDVRHAKAGRLEKQIDQAIRLNDVVLLVLSEHSTNSDWVEHEVRKAREKEKQTGKDALCPVALDDSWKTCRWPERLREQIMEYNILDFSNWQDEACFQKMIGKLLEGLNLFYK